MDTIDLVASTVSEATVGVVLMLALTALEPLLVMVHPFCVLTQRTLLAGVFWVNII